MARSSARRVRCVRCACSLSLASAARLFALTHSLARSVPVGLVALSLSHLPLQSLVCRARLPYLLAQSLVLVGSAPVGSGFEHCSLFPSLCLLQRFLFHPRFALPAEFSPITLVVFFSRKIGPRFLMLYCFTNSI